MLGHPGEGALRSARPRAARPAHRVPEGERGAQPPHILRAGVQSSKSPARRAGASHAEPL